MHSEPKIDPDQLQRLIDSELSSDEIRQLFETAEQHPAQWRTIACAFTEDQLFRGKFEMLAEEVCPKPVKPVKQVPKNTSESISQPMPLVRQLAIAASLAVAGLVGYLIGSDGPITTPDDSITGNMIAGDDSPTGTPSVTPVDLKPEYRMELLTPDGEAIDGEVDLYRYDDLYQLVNRGGEKNRVTLNDILPPSGFSTETRQQLSRSGYDINESTNFMSGRLQDGRQFVVPVRSIRFNQGH